MLIFLFMSVFFSGFCHILLPFLIVSWLYFLSSLSFNLNYESFSDFLYLDTFSCFLVYLTYLVVFLSYLYSLSWSGFSINLSFLSIVVFCLLVFCSSNYFILYLSYESSLLPILFIILNWGSYPDRSLSSFILLTYTAVFAFPLLFIIFYIFSFYGTLYLPCMYYSVPHLGVLSSFIVFMAFAVNLPIYGLHFWLPMAHVEAPTFGSIILAGVLLNLGGVGLLRSFFIDFSCLIYFILAYFFIMLVYSTLICCFQADYNRVVAYSSVSHMMCLPICLFSNNFVSLNSFYIIMFFHGLSSPLLFMTVGLLYSYYSTRQLLALRGLLLISPLISLLLLLSFLFSISTPPFPSFVGEAFFIISSFSLSSFSLYFFFFFVFLSLVYNVNWFSHITFSTTVCSNNVDFCYVYFFSLFFPLFICLPCLIYVSIFWGSGINYLNLYPLWMYFISIFLPFFSLLYFL